MQSNGIGNQPEYGAIFMSNSVTQKECLRRNLFGLVSKHGRFVKQIKAGMILFLFEYEKRQLHGVFEASSDGGMNIIPHAFSTSGICCPAQVRVRRIWTCEPLSESEFCCAIEDNYFTSKKFNFGLSELQVSRLLQLFGSKKSGVPRRVTKSRNSNLIVHSTTTNDGRQIDDTRTEVRDRINDEYVPGFVNTDTEPISATTTTGYLLTDKVETGISKYHCVDVPNDAKFLRNNECYDGFGLGSGSRTEYSLVDIVERGDSKIPIRGWGRSEYSPSTELRAAISTRSSTYRSGDVETFPSDGGFLRNEEFQNGYEKGNGYEPLTLSEHSSLLQSKLRGSVHYSSKPLEIRNYVPDQSTTQPSLINHQIQSRPLSDLYSTVTHRDAVVMSTHPYDYATPSLNSPHPLLGNEYNSHSAGQGYQPYCGYSDNAISSQKKRPFSSYLEQKGVTDGPDKISTLRANTSFSGPTPNENTYRGTTMEQTSYCKNLDADPEENQCFNGISSLKYSSADVSSIRTTTTDNKFSSSYPLSTNMYPSLDTYGYRVTAENQLQHEVARNKKREPFTSDIASAYADPSRLQDCLSPDDPRGFPVYDCDSLEYDPEHYQIPDTVFAGARKNRASVFSRLTFAEDVPEHDARVDVDDNDAPTSADDVMEMLHNSHRQWVRSKKPKPVKRHDDAEKFTRRKEIAATFHEGVLLGSKRRVNEKRTGFSPAGANSEADFSLGGGTDRATQFQEVKPFFNFKRRSEAKKLCDDGKSAVCDSSSMNNEGVLEGTRKKRKLIRPYFGKSDVASEDKDAKNHNSTLQALAEELPFASFESKERGVVFESERSLIVRNEVEKEFPIDNVKLQHGTISSDTLEETPNACVAISDSLALEPFLGAEAKNEVEVNECRPNREVDLLRNARDASDGACVQSSHRAIIDRINNSVDQFYQIQNQGARKKQ